MVFEEVVKIGFSSILEKSLNTKDTKYTKGKRRKIDRRFPSLNLCSFVFKKVFLLKTVEPRFEVRISQWNSGFSECEVVTRSGEK